MQIPTTINYNFNKAIEHLLEFHPVFYLGAGPALDVGKRPRGLRTDKDWQRYLDSLVSAMQIGLRNKWLHIHINRLGNPTYWLLQIPPHHIRPGKPIWSDEK